ncbi:MAG: VanZ family protein [Candidatus Binatia bacterium]
MALVTLYPYSFSFPADSTTVGFPFVGWGKSDDLDVFVNTLLFVPLGASLASIFTARAVPGRLVLMLIVAVSAGGSYGVEVLQVFLTHRFPSLCDVLANSFGAVVGFTCFHLWRLRNVWLTLAVYLILGVLATVLLQRSTRLSNWDATFPLLVGNEKTANRPWQGYVSHIYVADRALTDAEVARIDSVEHNLRRSLADSLLAWYDLPGNAERYPDETGHLPDLRWRYQRTAEQRIIRPFLGPHRWLETMGSVAPLIEKLRATSQFTLGVTVATSVPEQIGPARIVSLSIDPHRRNFTLGQQRQNLVFRLRTPISGSGKAELRAPGVFATALPQRVTVTYDGAVLQLYVNGVRTPAILEFGPGSALCSLFVDAPVLGTKVCKVIYYAGFCIPFGVLLVLAVQPCRPVLRRQLLVMGGGVIGVAFGLEWLLVSVSHKRFSYDNILISLVFTSGTVATGWLYRTLLKR